MARTHCKHGHPLTGENVFVRRNGNIECRACRNAADRRYREKPAAKERKRETKRCWFPEWLRRNEETARFKMRVRGETRWAIAAGKLTRLPCEVCGDPNSEAHHEDYSKPLDVTWLCITHHHERHPKPRKVA